MTALVRTSVVLAAVAGIMAADFEVVNAQGPRSPVERRLRPGRGFWSRDNQQPAQPSFQPYQYQQPMTDTRRGFSFQPVQPDVQTRRGFSYMPAQMAPGDRVVVTAERARIMRGTETLAVAERGLEFMVTEVRGPWVGGLIQVGDRTVRGWMYNTRLTPAGQVEAQGGSQRGDVE